MRILSFVLCGSFVLTSAPVLAQLKPVKVTAKTTFEVSDWMDEGGRLPKSGVALNLAVAKRAYFKNDKNNCINNLKAAYAKAPSIRHWITLQEYRCALIEKPKVADLERLSQRVRQNPKWSLTPQIAPALRPLFTEGLVHLAEAYAKNNRARAWQVINEALGQGSVLSDDQKANLYRVAGEISFVDQNLVSAKDYFQKSLNARDSSDLRKRVESITLALRTGDTATKARATVGFDQDVAVQKEKDLHARMTSAIQSKDYISAIDDAVLLLTNYPGGSLAADADAQISSLYLGLTTGSQDTWNQLKKRVLNSMKKAGGDRLHVWARLSYNRGRYQESFDLAEEAAEKLKGQAAAGEAWFLAGRAAHASMEPKLAQKAFEQVVEKYSGSPQLYEAMFRLGLIQFKKKDFAEAAATFERLISLKGGENFEYRGLYWAWRALQNLKQERAKDLAQRLIERYPMTLYGMKALAESTDGKIQLKSEKAEKLEVTLRLMPDQLEAWGRLPLLLRSGWFEEAQSELSQLPQPQTAEEHLIFTRLQSFAQGFVAAITHLNRAIELNPEYAYKKEYLGWVFPARFKTDAVKWSTARALDPLWVRSLIRQESAFQPRAVSRSNALGLMQLLPATASEVAQDLKKTKVQIPEDLFQPGVNVELGTSYLQKMLKQYSGQLPFALAAYNAGPTRLKNWLESSGNKVEESELWVDELPWSETSFYVKSILRNILIFEMLDKGQIQLSSPIWQISAKNP